MQWQNWVPDPFTAGLTGLILTLIFMTGRKLRTAAKHWWSYILQGIGFHLRKAVARSLAARLTAWDYAAKQLHGPTQFLRVPGRTPAEQIKTDRIFVPLALEDLSKEYDHNNALELGSRLRIIGDPGSGKSTILKKIFRDECRRLRRLTFTSKARLPILFELKTLTIPEQLPDAGLGEWVLEQLIAEMAKSKAYEINQCVDAYLRSGRLLVLFDGADEILSTQYPRIESALLRFSETLRHYSEGNIVVLTMRTQFHRQVGTAYDLEYLRPIVVKPFSPTDIYVFLRNWEFPRDAGSHINRIFADLSDRPNLRDMSFRGLFR